MDADWTAEKPCKWQFSHDLIGITFTHDLIGITFYSFKQFAVNRVVNNYFVQSVRPSANPLRKELTEVLVKL